MGRSNVGRVAFSPNGKHLAVSATSVNLLAQTTEVMVWDPATGKQRFVLKLSGQASLIAFSLDSKRFVTNSGINLMTGQTGNEVKVWDTATGLELATLRGKLAIASNMAFNADGTKLMVIGSDVQLHWLLLQVWDARPLVLNPKD